MNLQTKGASSRRKYKPSHCFNSDEAKFVNRWRKSNDFGILKILVKIMNRVTDEVLNFLFVIVSVSPGLSEIDNVCKWKYNIKLLKRSRRLFK